MLTLAVDQSSAVCGLALLEDGRPLAEDTWPGDRSHGQDLYARLPRLLARCGRALPAVDVFAVGLGPGAFSALRTSLSYFQALVLPDHKPVIGVESAAALAWDTWRETALSPIAVVGDARRERLWAAKFEPSAAEGMPAHADFILLRQASSATQQPDSHGDTECTENAPSPRPLCLRGESSCSSLRLRLAKAPEAEELATFLAQARVVVTPHWERIGGLLRASAHKGLRVVEGSRSPTALSVAELAARRMQAGAAIAEPPAPLTPVYLFPPVSVPPRFPAPR